jgi:hypothetical protein
MKKALCTRGVLLTVGALGLLLLTHSSVGGQGQGGTFRRSTPPDPAMRFVVVPQVP